MLKRLVAALTVCLCACVPAQAQTLTANDFVCFINRAAAGDPYANCDGVGGVTANDFQCFINRFAAGDSWANCDGSVPPATGWTNLPLPAGAVAWYVAANGNDTNPGTFSAPFRSPQRGVNSAANFRGDHVLLRSGDTWTGLSMIGVPTGGSAGKPLVIGAYGAGARPRLMFTGTGFRGEATGNHNVAFVGLSIEGAHVVDTSGIIMLSRNNVLVEDCFISGFRDNIVIQDAASNGSVRVTGLKIRRNVIVDAWFTGGNSQSRAQGFYIGGCDGWLIEENVIDRCGVVGSIFSHNGYVHETCGPGNFIGNITARSASEGIQGRPGGVCRNNLGLQNSYDFMWNGGTVEYNSAIDAADIGPQGRGMGLLVYGSTTVRHNFAGYNVTGTGWGNCKGMVFRDFTGAVVGNIVYDWRDNGGHNQGVAFAFDSLVGPVTVTGNSGYQPAGNFITEGNPGGSGNRWAGNAPNPGSGWSAVPMPADPLCRISDYMIAIGEKPATLDGFMTMARAQRRGAWDERITADAVNDFVGVRSGVQRP